MNMTELCDSQIPASNATRVALRSLVLTTTGRYRCEVSAEAPSFQTVSDHGDLLVVGETLDSVSIVNINHINMIEVFITLSKHITNIK